MPSFFFKVLGTISGVAVIILWCIAMVGTLRGAIKGSIFEAPYLANLLRKNTRRISLMPKDRELLICL